jgi:hypothetical protein
MSAAMHQDEPKELSNKNDILGCITSNNGRNSNSSGKNAINNSRNIHDVHQLNSKSSGELWNLEGTVAYIGTDCNPESKFFAVPPCSGGYPKYKFEIFAQETKAKTTIETDSNGDFKILLEPGSYVINLPSVTDHSGKNFTSFTIQENNITRLDTLFVDSGLE